MTAVYIAGPLGQSMANRNVHKAMKAGNDVLNAKMHFYIPHLMWHFNNKFPKSYEQWMAEDFFWLDKCDCLLRIPGESPGADREVEYALQHGKPVFHCVEDIVTWEKSQQSVFSS